MLQRRGMPPRARWLGLLGLFFLLSWACTACVVTPVPAIIKIGLVAPFEGRYRYIGYDAIYAARLAVREINAAGGIEGYRLVLVSYDDRHDPALARTMARNLIVDPDVVAVVGHYRQATTVAAQPHYAEQSLPLLAVGAWLTDTQTSTNQLAPSPERLAEAMIAEATGAGNDCVAVWGDDALAQALSQRLDKEIRCPQGGEPAFVLSTLPPHVTGLHLKEQRAAGWQGTVVGGPDLGAWDFAEVAGAAVAEGTCFVTPHPFPEDLPETEAWIQAYESLGPHVPKPGAYALPTYEAVNLLGEALVADIAAHGRPSRMGMVDALNAVSHEGRLGTITLDARGVWQDAPLYLYSWRAGEPRLERMLAP